MALDQPGPTPTWPLTGLTFFRLITESGGEVVGPAETMCVQTLWGCALPVLAPVLGAGEVPQSWVINTESLIYLESLDAECFRPRCPSALGGRCGY